jgi:hypothetical protein
MEEIEGKKGLARGLVSKPYLTYLLLALAFRTRPGW